MIFALFNEPDKYQIQMKPMEAQCTCTHSIGRTQQGSIGCKKIDNQHMSSHSHNKGDRDKQWAIYSMPHRINRTVGNVHKWYTRSGPNLMHDMPPYDCTGERYGVKLRRYCAFLSRHLFSLHQSVRLFSLLTLNSVFYTVKMTSGSLCSDILWVWFELVRPYN